jgi:hypothetical protein
LRLFCLRVNFWHVANKGVWGVEAIAELSPILFFWLVVLFHEFVQFLFVALEVVWICSLSVFLSC